MGLRADRQAVSDLPDRVADVAMAIGIDPSENDHGDLPGLRDEPGFEIVTNAGQEHVTHEGLIDMAHQDGLAMTYTEPVQIPPEEKINEDTPVIFRAFVVTRRGLFTGYGDAVPGDTMVDAIKRMAETRALNRALRDAVNVGGATAEEMPDADVEIK